MGTKLGGDSAFRVVSITQAVASCKVARLKVLKRQDATGRLSQRQPKENFFEGFRSNVRHFSRSLLERYYYYYYFSSVLGTKLGGVSVFRVVSITQAVASCKVARLKVSKRQDATGRFSQRQVKDLFSRLSEATLGTFSGHFWSVLGTKLGGVSAFRVVSITQAVASCKVARLKVSKRQDATGRLSQRQVKDLFF